MEGFGTGAFLVFVLCIAVFIVLLCMNIFRSRRENQEEVPGAQQRPQEYNADICPICWDAHKFGIETNCGHLYCGCCFKTYCSRNRQLWSSGVSCPLCRERACVFCGMTVDHLLASCPDIKLEKCQSDCPSTSKSPIWVLPVGLLFICYTAEERTGDQAVLRGEITYFVRRYNRVMSNNTTIWDRISEIPTLLKHFINHLLYGDDFGAQYVRLRLILYIFGTIMYIVLPHDLVSELNYGSWGYAEDFFILALLIFYLAAFYRNYIGGD